jgi:hypothetical protein
LRPGQLLGRLRLLATAALIAVIAFQIVKMITWAPGAVVGP